ncbi:mesenteric estrogen-dependent adipogenesis protein isoform X3 [Anabas testudineus]|uniref:mesenteric estrogen-dependent adipogenesis protein isoform X3 n=1 Tax=Anabas testudineus TaxID=64144 RepID=UPI000E464567|nr:mesenteric estrogen-dependent adipogenesis protein isoform X3 [Anabas testudineus]
MTRTDASHSRVTLTEVEDFLRTPPPGFSVDSLGSGYRVRSDPETSLVLIDDLDLCRGKVVFHNSMGRKVKMHNLWEYSRMRKSLLSKNIYLLMSACEGNKSARKARVLKQYVVSIDGNDALIKWQLEKGLDWTISSVAGESYRVDIDLSEALMSCVGNIITNKEVKVRSVRIHALFTLKYCSDALFDFPHWFGFSKRQFNVTVSNSS